MPNLREPRIGGIILCGGHSRRMGSPKANLPFGPQTMLERMVEILSGTVAPIAIVTAAHLAPPRLPPEIIIAQDEYADAGPLGGLHAGLTAILPHAEIAFATACDAPLLKPAIITELARQMESADLAIPRDGEYHHPLMAIYRTALVHKIEDLLSAGIRRPVELLNHVTAHEVNVDQLRPVDPNLDSFRNLNTPEAYHQALLDAGLETP
ncbi:MAG TPA: molybdopterin-guanine dinucleotide biosynthesis protein MobA [Planctomycetaceae bacterium]|nr:molybdopterin-guanine dinucleotide biosynthesis protein MobA [Planctomycetaceae bacterium]